MAVLVAVLMAERRLGLRKRSYGAVDAHGDVAAAGLGAIQGPWPGRAREEADNTWTLAVDAAAWPVVERDVIVDPDSGQEWVVTTAAVLRNALDPSVDYVRCTALPRAAGDVIPPPATAGQVGP